MAERSGSQHSRYRRWNNPEVCEDMTRRYVQDRQSLRQIAAELGCSYGTVHLMLTAAGVQLRPRGGSPRRTTEPAAQRPQPPTAATVGAESDTSLSHRPWSRS
jgi:hypothetical protein